MPPAESSLLVAEGLSMRFGKTEALVGVNVRVRAKQVVGLVGPDGAGKTTFLRLAAGLLKPAAGSLAVLGLDAGRESIRVQEQVGYMPQRFGLYEDLTVQENLDLYADLQAVPPHIRADRFQKLLEMTDLKRFTSRLSGKLSGGMKQKLGLACALIKLPRLLLLDEPTVGVDPVSRRDLWKIVYQMIDEQGIGVLLSTAYLDEADRCHEVYLLHRGKVLDSGPPAHFHEQVAGRVWRVDPGDRVAREVRQAMEQSPAVIDAALHAGRVRVVTHEPNVKAVRAIAKGLGVEPGTPTFEDAFMAQMHAQPHEMKPPDTGIRPLSDPREGKTAKEDVVVRVAHLTKRFGAFTAVDNISFDVHRGEVFGLLGPNGAGKTTTFRMLCGLLSASDGRLEVAGNDLRRSGADARARLGYMAQKFSLYGLLSARENLHFYGQAYGLDRTVIRQRVQVALDEYDLHERADDPADSLPGGYKQRLAMAVALLHRPEVLFLDEPTSGVDPLARREFWGRITRAAATGVTVIVTTHFMEEAEYCDRMLIQSRGKMLALGTPAEVRGKVATPSRPEPTMEEAFIELAEQADRDEAQKQGAANAA